MSNDTPLENWKEIIKRSNQQLGSNGGYTVSGHRSLSKSRAFKVPRKEKLLREYRGYAPSNNESNYTETGRRKDSLASENVNFLKRIWLTAKDITHRNEVANSIERYQKILQMPEDPEDLTTHDLKLLVAPIGLNSKSRTWKNYFTGKPRFETVSGLRKKMTKNGKTYRSNRNRLFRNFEGNELLTQESLRSYKINAYNELIALMLILMEKAQDKFANDNIFDKVGKKASGWFTSDSGGILHIDNLTEDYVYNILGYNLEPKIKMIYDNIKKAKDSKENWDIIVKTLVTVVSIGIYAVTMMYLFNPTERTERFCTDGSAVMETTYMGTCYSWRLRPYTCMKESSKCNYGSGIVIDAAKRVISYAAPFVTHTAEVTLALSVTHGISIGIWASYKIYVMQRGYRRGLLLKDIFVDIHKTIFNENNTLLFEDIQDELFIYNTLSQGEKDILNNLSKVTILSKKKKDFDENVHEYISAFIEARTQHKMELVREITEKLQESDDNSDTPVANVREQTVRAPREYRRTTPVEPMIYRETVLTPEENTEPATMATARLPSVRIPTAIPTVKSTARRGTYRSTVRRGTVRPTIRRGTVRRGTVRRATIRSTAR